MGSMVIAIVFDETENVDILAEILDRAKKVANDVPDVKVTFTRGDAAETIRFFCEKGELPVDGDPEDDESMLVRHAKREMALVETDPWFIQGIVDVVRAFAKNGHSGSSASHAIPLINQLLQFQNLSPLTDDPNEWIQHTDETWQSSRRHDAFSKDKGKTYYLLSEGGNDENPHPAYATKKKEDS